MTTQHSLIARSLRLAREVLLTAGAVVGAVSVGVLVAALLLDARALVFRSGSMAPTIETGALAIARQVPATDLRVGDIVSVTTADHTRVTHRIAEIEQEGEDRRALTLRGDANRVADAQPYVVEHADRVVFAVPRVGYAAAWLASPVGLVLLGAYVMFLLGVLFRRGAPAPRR